MIMRHPFEQIASRVWGLARGKFHSMRSIGDLHETAVAARFGITADDLAEMPPVERMAWEWAILHEKAYAELSARSNATILRYVDLVSDPVGQARSLFGFAGLAWDPATERFIHQSTNYRGPDLYYHVRKSGNRPLHKWREVLSDADQICIARVIQGTCVGQLWPDFRSPQPDVPLSNRGFPIAFSV
jgi:hypothetical protein